MNCPYRRFIKGASEDNSGHYCTRFWFVLCCDLCLACQYKTRSCRHVSESPHLVRASQPAWPAEALRRIAREGVPPPTRPYK